LITGNGFDDGSRGIGTPAVILSTGEGNVAEGNTLCGNRGGIQIDYRCRSCKVTNNTILQTRDLAAIQIGSTATDTVVQDNRFAGNKSDIDDQGQRTQLSNNTPALQSSAAEVCSAPPKGSRPPFVQQPPAPKNLRAVAVTP
jgi:parallel beta-helix repeat protein